MQATFNDYVYACTAKWKTNKQTNKQNDTWYTPIHYFITTGNSDVKLLSTYDGNIIFTSTQDEGLLPTFISFDNDQNFISK